MAEMVNETATKTEEKTLSVHSRTPNPVRIETGKEIGHYPKRPYGQVRKEHAQIKSDGTQHKSEPPNDLGFKRVIHTPFPLLPNSMMPWQTSLTHNISARASKYQSDSNEGQNKSDCIVVDPAQKKITGTIDSTQNKQYDRNRTNESYQSRAESHGLSFALLSKRDHLSLL